MIKEKSIIFTTGMALALFIWVLILYYPSWSFPPVFDSAPQFGDIQLYKSSISNFTILEPRIITYLTMHFIDQLFGPDIFWQNLFNSLLHGLNAILLFVFLQSFFRKNLSPTPETNAVKSHQLGAFLAVLFFVSTPASVYTVAYTIQRSLLLGSFFSLLTLMTFIKGAETSDRKRKWIYWILSILCYALGLRSKEMVIMLPAMIFIWLFFFNTNPREQFKKAWPVFLFFAFFAGEIVLRQSGILGRIYEPQAVPYFGSTQKTPISDLLASVNPAMMLPLSAINQSYLFFAYLFLWTVPYVRGMAIDLHFTFPQQMPPWPESLGIIGFIAYGLMALSLLRKRNATKLLGFGLLWPWMFFLVEFSTVRVAESFVLYRGYIWMIGFTACLPWFLQNLPRALRLTAPVLYILLLAIFLRERLATLSNAINVWQDALTKLPEHHEKNPGAYRAYYSLGYELVQTGRDAEALAYLDKAIEIMPGDHPPYYNKALALDKLGRVAEAEALYRKCIEINPDYAEAYNNLGGLLVKRGQSSAALEYFQKAIDRWPDFAKPYNNMGVALDKLGRWEDAVSYYKKSLELDPDFPKGPHNLAKALKQLKRHEEALNVLNAFLKKNPRDFEALMLIGHIYYDQADFLKALNSYMFVTQFNSTSAEPYFHAGNCLVRLEQIPAAVKMYQKAITHNPGDDKIYYNLGTVLAKTGDQENAKKAFEEAFRLNPGLKAKD